MSLPAAEVAADFRDALQDLRMNSRPEISNLTLIAKENTEYAQAISTELEQHIKSVRFTLGCLPSSLSTFAC
jgi:pre-mRNA cleavage complex 2 protein Pcf11